MISISEFSCELDLVEWAVAVYVGLLDELLDVCIADLDVQVLWEDVFYFVESHLILLLVVEQLVHVIDFGLLALAEEPLLADHGDDVSEVERLLRLVNVVLDFLLDLLDVHLGKSEVAQNAPHLGPVDVAWFLSIVEVKAILYFIFLITSRIPFLLSTCTMAASLSWSTASPTRPTSSCPYS